MRLIRGVSVVGLGLVSLACAERDPVVMPELDPALRPGGSNCAEADPVMLAPDGSRYPFPTVLAYFARQLHIYREDSGPFPFVAVESGFPVENWLGKLGELFGREDGFARGGSRVVHGKFGWAPDWGASERCAEMDRPYHIWAQLGITALAQASRCDPVDGDGYYKVSTVSVLHEDLLYPLDDLVAAGILVPAPPEECIFRRLPECYRFNPGAWFEGVVVPLGTDLVVPDPDGAPRYLGVRAFAMRGDPPPSQELGRARRVLQSSELAIGKTVGDPTFQYVGVDDQGRHLMRYAGTSVGPLVAPNAALTSYEQGIVTDVLGRYEEQCYLDLDGDGVSEYVPEDECATSYVGGVAVIVTNPSVTCGDCPDLVEDAPELPACPP